MCIDRLVLILTSWIIRCYLKAIILTSEDKGQYFFQGEQKRLFHHAVGTGLSQLYPS